MENVMDNNINYVIEETKNETFAKSDFELKLYDIDLYSNCYAEGNQCLDYSFEELYMFFNSYNLKGLTHIMNYYGLTTHNINNKKKLTKDEIIQLLVLFELDVNNRERVLKRRRLWQNIAELISDHFFKSFIMFKV